jgi:hypothetical protein
MDGPFGWYDGLTILSTSKNNGDGRPCAGRHWLVKVQQKQARTARAVPIAEMPVKKLTRKTNFCLGDDLVGLNLRGALLTAHGWNVIKFQQRP